MVAEGYKNTEIGVIPKDWKVVIIKSLGKTFGGLSGKSKNDFENGNCHYIPFMNIMSNAVVDTTYFDYVYIKEGESQNKALKNDLFFNTSSETPKEVGMCSVLLENIPNLYLNSFCFGFRLNNEKENNGLYLSYFFRSSYGRKFLFPLAQGTTRHNLSKNNFLTIKIPLPPLSEQNAIATTLSDADALISATERLIAKKKAIKQGAMQELLKPKEGWEEKSLGNLGFIKSSSVDKIIHPNETIVNLLNYMDVYKNILIDKSKISAITSANSIQCNSMNLIKGDIVFTPTSETPNDIGRASLIIEDLTKTVFSYHLTRLRFYDDIIVNELKPYIFNSEQLRAYFTIRATGSTRFVLKKADFEDAVISFPKSKSEQTRIATILSDMDAEISLLEQKLEKQKQIKQGMMQNLLTGKIRLLENADKQVKKPKHNEQINEAVIISFLVHKFGTKKYPLSRFRYTKYAYLLHRQSEREARGFNKHAAGPYNPANRYKGAEDIAVKNKYITKVQNPTSQNDAFVVNENIEGALNYFQEWYGTEIQQWIEQFRFYKNEYLEVLTTVDKAICELAQKRNTIDVQNIKAYIDSIPQWKKKLEKPYFSDIEIQRAIDESNKLFGNG